MKKQYVIPIFVPHLGCPNDCIFCNQKSISGQKKNMLFQQIYEDISKNLVPIRPDRHYTRTKGQLAGKYSNTHKRAY